MLTRIYGKFVAECDACGETLQTNTKDFNEARDAMRAAKWTALQIGSDWVHTCAGCQDRAAKDRRARARGTIP